MIRMEITDRKGYHLDTIVCSAKNRPEIHAKLKAKYGTEHYCFAATPSEPTNSPLRKASPRKFVMVSEC